MIRRSVMIAALLLAGCDDQQPPGSEPPPSASDVVPSADPGDEGGIEGAWVLAHGTVDGDALGRVADARVTMIIEGTELSGIAACNHYGGRFVMGADGLRIENFGMTAMACGGEVMILESAYLDALMRVRALTPDGEALVARGDGVELRFDALDAPPTAALADTRWRLDGLIDGDAVAAPMGEPAWLELRSDGTFAGSTGCRSFQGQWLERGDEIITPTWGMDETECPALLQGQDSHVVTVIGDGFIPTVDAGGLTLMDVDGTGLAYRVDR